MVPAGKSASRAPPRYLLGATLYFSSLSKYQARNIRSLSGHKQIMRRYLFIKSNLQGLRNQAAYPADITRKAGGNSPT